MSLTKQIFIAEILREVTVGGKNSYCEVAFIVIKTPTHQEAELLANDFGKSSERSYQNPEGDLVVWKFIKVIGVNPALCEEIGEVTEIFCHMYKNMVSYEASLPLHQLE
jgi:hypothetical protein